MSLKDEIISLSKMYNIDEIGFTKLDFNYEYENLENEMYDKGYITSFHKKYNLDNYKDYNSAIVILVNYYNDKIIEVRNKDKNYVHFSLSSWGEDYHKVLNDKLTPLKEFLNDKGYKTKVCVDNNELSERDLAINAGLGYVGINGQFINDTLGSFVFIGVLLTDALFEYDTKVNKTCLKCMKCKEMCPTKSIKGDGSVNGNTCLSYITQKKELTDDEASLINNCIYGCDVCSLVCPHNQNLKNTTSFKELGIECINVNEYKSLSNKEFNEKYGSLSCSWRGKRVIERNINIIKEKLENE